MSSNISFFVLWMPYVVFIWIVMLATMHYLGPFLRSLEILKNYKCCKSLQWKLICSVFVQMKELLEDLSLRKWTYKTRSLANASRVLISIDQVESTQMELMCIKLFKSECVQHIYLFGVWNKWRTLREK